MLAVATWFYVFDLVNDESFRSRKETVDDVFSRYKFSSKELAVKPMLTGKAPTGYNISLNNITVTPSNISVFAPEDILVDLAELRTEMINLGEYTKTATVRVRVLSDNKFLNLKDKIVDVYIPVTAAQKEEPK